MEYLKFQVKPAGNISWFLKPYIAGGSKRKSIESASHDSLTFFQSSGNDGNQPLKESLAFFCIHPRNQITCEIMEFLSHGMTRKQLHVSSMFFPHRTVNLKGLVSCHVVGSLMYLLLHD